MVCSFNWQIHKWGNLQIVVSLPLSFVENNIEKVNDRLSEELEIKTNVDTSTHIIEGKEVTISTIEVLSKESE